jgi:hypothetical protein
MKRDKTNCNSGKKSLITTPNFALKYCSSGSSIMAYKKLYNKTKPIKVYNKKFNVASSRSRSPTNPHYFHWHCNFELLNCSQKRDRELFSHSSLLPPPLIF